MYLLLRLIQKLIATLNSDGTPGQVAAGLTIGTIFGLTPLLSMHNLVFLAIVVLTRMSVTGAMLGWLAAVPVGFLLDPWFDALGQKVLSLPSLSGFWTYVTNTPVLALTNINNSVVLGSLLGWCAVAGPLYVVARWGMVKYRATVYAKLRRSKLFQTVRASKLYNAYRLFRPG